MCWGLRIAVVELCCCFNVWKLLLMEVAVWVLRSLGVTVCKSRGVQESVCRSLQCARVAVCRIYGAQVAMYVEVKVCNGCILRELWCADVAICRSCGVKL